MRRLTMFLTATLSAAAVAQTILPAEATRASSPRPATLAQTRVQSPAADPGQSLFRKAGSGLIAQAAPVASATTPIPENVLRVRYVRPDGQYGGWGLHVWEDTTATVEWSKPLPPTGRDAGGLYWDVPLKAGAQKVGFIVHKGDEKDPGPDMFADPSKGREVTVTSGQAEFAYGAPAVLNDPPVPAGTARINYYRPDGQYEGWGLHVWEDTTAQVEWTKPLPQTGKNSFG
ncbi:MAG: pullulanase-associated domain-containing protein, partial [Deinococcota bacterium]